MKILVVSGFLGSGKTTFIKTMTEKTGQNFVIYENEYAGSGVDTERLKETSELEVWESLNNCVCCSGKTDFAEDILTISGTVDPDYLIVEPTGAAKLSSVISNIRAVEYDRISLLKPVVMADPLNYAEQKREFSDILTDQIKNASSVIISRKTSDPELIKYVIDDIKTINPNVDIISEDYSTADSEWFMKLLDDGSISDNYPKDYSDESEELDKIVLRNISLSSPSHLITFLNSLIYRDMGYAVRAKGSLKCGNEWIKFDLVGMNWSVTGDSERDESQIVIIGKHLDKAQIRKKLQGSPLEIKLNMSNTNKSSKIIKMLPA